MRLVCFLLATIFLSAAALRAETPASRIAGYFADQAKEGGFNGNILVAENGHVVVAKSFGYADFEKHLTNTSATQFEMASISKLFTAVAVLQLSEAGKIGLDDTLATYFPAFPYKGITIRQLLSHSSGLSDQQLEPLLAEYAERHGHTLEMDDLVPAIAAADVKLTLKPGEKWWYSNLGYQLLAALVELRSGMRFDAYLQAHILCPARMAHTFLRTGNINTAGTSQTAQNYDYPFRYGNKLEKLSGKTGYYNKHVYGNSNIVSTTDDMLAFDNALYHGHLLKPATLDAAFTPQKLADGSPVFVWKNIGGMGDADDGLGWFVFRDKKLGRIVWHAGGMTGCVTIFLRAIDHHQTVVIFDNTTSENLYKKGLSALRLLNGLDALPTPKSLARIYGRTLFAEGEDAGFATLFTLKDDAVRYSVSEDELNNLGYLFAGDGHTKEALATFRAAIALWPESDNLSESYGEVLEAAGHKQEAAAMYRRALARNPQNSEAKAKLAALNELLP